MCVLNYRRRPLVHQVGAVARNNVLCKSFREEISRVPRHVLEPRATDVIVLVTSVLEVQSLARHSTVHFGPDRVSHSLSHIADIKRRFTNVLKPACKSYNQSLIASDNHEIHAAYTPNGKPRLRRVALTRAGAVAPDAEGELILVAVGSPTHQIVAHRL